MALDTACPPRRSCVASAARRRGQACTANRQHRIAFGAGLPTTAVPACVDNPPAFTPVNPAIADT
jgi:hypothetical protein